jgi:E3 ubiquitin-protein ligase synoviolin
MNKDLQYFLIYFVVSTGLISWSIFDSLGNAINFLTFLTEFTDGFKLGIIINFIILNFIIVCKFIQVVMFGELRVIEIEHLMERLPIFAVNLLFNLATDDSNLLPNVFLLGLSVVFKIFFTILMDRLDFVNLKIINNLMNHSTKYSVIIKYIANKHFWANIVVIMLDFTIAKLLIFDVFQGVNSVTCLLFGFQFAVQGVEAMSYFAKLVLTIYELVMYRLEENIDDEDEEEDDQRIWDNKAYYSKGIDIASALLRSVSYISFIYLLTFHSGLSLPISLLQGTYSSLKQAYSEITQLISFIELSKKFESQLPTATKQELEATDNLCIICREDMYSHDDYQETFKKPLNSRKYAKKLRCGHILHMGCLKEWLERSDSCPLCRNKVFDTTSSGPGEAATNNNNNGNNNDNNNDNNNINVPNPPEALQQRIQEFAGLVNRHRGPENTGIVDLNAPQEATQTPIPNDHLAMLNEASTTPQTLSTSNLVPTPTIPLDAISQTEQPPPPSSSSSPLTPNYQTIRLPTTALIPPNWILLPLERKLDGQGYIVSFSTQHKGSILARNNETNRELNLIRPS